MSVKLKKSFAIDADLISDIVAVAESEMTSFSHQINKFARMGMHSYRIRNFNAQTMPYLAWMMFLTPESAEMALTVILGKEITIREDNVISTVGVDATDNGQYIGILSKNMEVVACR